MKYAFHPEALTEYAEAVRYYADSDVNLAQAFINAIENVVFFKLENLHIATLLWKKIFVAVWLKNFLMKIRNFIFHLVMGDSYFSFTPYCIKL